MAKAEVVMVDVVTTVKQEGITLTLDKREVAVLKFILNRIGGDMGRGLPLGQKTGHMVADDISNALNDEGVKFSAQRGSTDPFYSKYGGSIYFDDKPIIV